MALIATPSKTSDAIRICLPSFQVGYGLEGGGELNVELSRRWHVKMGAVLFGGGVTSLNFCMLCNAQGSEPEPFSIGSTTITVGGRVSGPRGGFELQFYKGTFGGVGR